MKKIGVKFVLDEQKIQNEGEYNLEKIYEFIDKNAEKYLIKIGKGEYQCFGDEQDLSNMGIFNLYFLSKQEWFTKNVKQWEWIEDNRVINDMIQLLKQHNIGLWNE